MTIGYNRINVTLISLAPLHRKTLEIIAASQDGVRLKQLVPSISMWPSDAKEKLYNLKKCGLVIVEYRGKYPVYLLAEGVRDAMKSIPSLGPDRYCIDPDVGLAVLEAARDLVSNREWPSGRLIGEMIGYGKDEVRKWIQRLKIASIFPDTRGLGPRDRMVSERRAEAEFRQKHARMPAEPKSPPHRNPRMGRVCYGD